MRSNGAKIAGRVQVLALACLSATAVAAQTQTPSAVSAANHFLSTLNDKQRQDVLFAFDDEKQRTRWSNFPIAMVPRAGISLKDMNADQRSAVMALLASVLSERGLEKVQQIMEGDEVNKTTDTGPHGFGNGGPRGNRAPGSNSGPPPGMGNGGPPSGSSGRRPPFGDGPIFGRDLYYISFLGKPSEKNPWILQFGGHHLALKSPLLENAGFSRLP